MSLSLTNEIVGRRLSYLNIKRLDDYVNNRTKIRFQCLQQGCELVWVTIPGNILGSDSGCPKCSGKLRLSNTEIDSRLASRTIKRVGNYNGSISNKIEWQCLICSNIWLASIRNIVHAYNGCPLCKNKNEKIIYSCLTKNDLIFEHQKSLRSIGPTTDKNYRVDFYLPTYKMIIEYNGHQHYIPVRFGNSTFEEASRALGKQKIRDEYVRYFCVQNNISLLEIDGRAVKNDLLIEFINNIVDKLTEKEK